MTIVANNLDEGGIRSGPGSLAERHGQRTDIVYERIRKAILSGELPAGTRLIETDLADEFQVSRGPVREALRALQQHGLVVRERNRGACVAGITSRREVLELHSLLTNLQSFALSLAASRITVEELAALSALYDQMDAARVAGDIWLFNEIELQWLDQLVRAADHRVLHTTWRPIFEQWLSKYLRTLELFNEDLDHSLSTYTAVLNALRDGKGDIAALYLRHGYAEFLDQLLSRLPDSPEDDGGHSDPVPSTSGQ